MVNINSSFTHITFSVENMDISLQFYSKWFGLTVHKDRRPKGNTVWLINPSQKNAEVPNFVFVLHEGTVSKIDHFGFQVESRDDIYRISELAKSEGILRGGPEDLGGIIGVYVLIEDPNGHIWEFTHGQPIEGI